jgi:UDP-N-acetylmuramoylalanine--D-glutamate ligase
MGVGESGQAMAKWAYGQGAQVSMHDTRPQHTLSQSAIEKVKELQDLGIHIRFGKDENEFNMDGIDVISYDPGISLRFLDF